MNSKKEKLLTKLLGQYKAAHQGKLPAKIVVEPLALVALGIKQSAAPVWGGVPVECREIEREEAVKPGPGGNALGVLLDTRTSQIVACNLNSVH